MQFEKTKKGGSFENILNYLLFLVYILCGRGMDTTLIFHKHHDVKVSMVKLETPNIKAYKCYFIFIMLLIDENTWKTER